MSTQEKILAAARQEFAARGLDGARVDRIAQTAGVNKAMIYYHFRSKEHLYDTVVQQFLESVKTFLDRVLTEETDLENLLLEVAKFYGQVFDDVSRDAPHHSSRDGGRRRSGAKPLHPDVHGGRRPSEDPGALRGRGAQGSSESPSIPRRPLSRSSE